MKRLRLMVCVLCLVACSSSGGPRPTTLQVVAPADEVWLAANSAALSVGARIRHSNQRTQLLVAQLFMDSIGSQVEIEVHIIDGPDGGRLEIRTRIPGRDLPYSDEINAELESLQERLAAAIQTSGGRPISRSVSGTAGEPAQPTNGLCQEVK